MRACWAQWVALGSGAAPAAKGIRARAMIDPEALVLTSLVFERDERRLVDMVGWWARVGSTLTSVQRFRSVAERFPEDSGLTALARFASLAVEHGDRRWGRHAEAASRSAPARDKGPAAVKLADAAALWLRLRAGLGVGAKADVLAFLLGSGGAWATAEQIAFATGYSTVAARTAAAEMAAAGFLREGTGRPARWAASPEAWSPLLASQRSERLPPWRFWAEIFAFLAGAAAWHADVRDAGASSTVEEGGTPAGARSPHVTASRARDLVERHARAFELSQVPVPTLAGYPGLRAVDALLETTRAVAGWIEQRL